MSSPNHSTSDIEDAFYSMNILNYTSVSSDYLEPKASKEPRKIYSHALKYPSLLYIQQALIKKVQIIVRSGNDTDNPQQPTLNDVSISDHMAYPIGKSYGQNPPWLDHSRGGHENDVDSSSPLTRWIEEFQFPDGLKVPPHVGYYDGKGDPDNFIHVFEGEIRMEK
ncbi:hypothetical protein Tco_1514696 [Tanacetum coccineum]